MGNCQKNSHPHTSNISERNSKTTYQESMSFTPYEHVWSVLVIGLCVVSIWSVISFTRKSHSETGWDWLVGDNENGRTKSISEMILQSDGKIVAGSYAGLNTSMMVVLAFYCCHVWPRIQIAYKAYPKLLLVQFFSFALACSSVQNVITITSTMHLELHFVYAGFFYMFASVTVVISTFQEYKYFQSNKNCRLQDKIRFGLNVTASVIMVLTWMFFLFSTFTHRSINKIDQRPPVIWGELSGIVGILFYCVSLLPYLDHSNISPKSGDDLFGSSITDVQDNL